MTAFYDFFRFIKLYSTDGTTLEHTIEADAVTDTLSISRGTGVSWTPASSATDSFKIDVNYNLEVPVGTTTLRLTDVHSVDQDIDLVAGGNMTITRNNSGSITIAALMGGVSKVITLATQTNPVVITTNTAHDYTEGTPVTIVDVVGMTDLNGNEYYANVLTSNTLALYTDEGLATSLDGTGFGAYTSGGVVTGEYAGAKKLNDLVDVKFNAPNFTDSIMLGYTTTGTLNNAHSNIFIGKDAGKTVTSGNQNTVIGHQAGDSITTGEKNVLIGYQAGDGISTGDGNVIIGDYAASSNNTTAIYTGDGTQRLFIGPYGTTLDGVSLTGQYYSNLWQHSTQVGAFRAQGESGATTVTNPPYATTYLERAYITIDATNNPVTHQPARIHVGGGHLALHGGDGFVVGSTMTEYAPGQWGASGTRTPGTYTGVTVSSGVVGNHPTFTVVVAVSDGSITSVTSETTGSGIYDLTGTNTISDSQIGNGGAPDIQFKYEGTTTTQAKLTMIGDTTLAVTTAGATINSKDVILDGAVTSHLIPDTDIAYDLGSATHKFRDLYLDGSSIHLGSTILRDDGSGNLQANLTNILEIAADDSTIRTINSGESIKFIGAGSVSTATDAEGNLTITGDVAGANTEIQFNDNGSFGASSDVTWDGTDFIVDTGTFGNIKAGGSIHTSNAYLTGTATGNTVGPLLYLERDSSSPANGDKLGVIKFKGNNSASSSGASTVYNFIHSTALSVTNGAEESSLDIGGLTGGYAPTLYRLTGTMFQMHGSYINSIEWNNSHNTVYTAVLTTATPTAHRTWTLPDATGTLATQSYVNTQITASEVSDLTGSVFGDDSTVLVDGVNNSINLDGTVKGHIIPDTNNTYDIGSASFKIRDLYVSDNSIHIGDTGTIGITADVMTVAGATGGFKAVAFTGNSGVAIDEFSTDGTMADNSDTAVPTEKAVKTYVDLGTNPTGSIIAFAGITAPTGWLLCYGQAVLRTTYAGLFTVLAEVYGVGDGSTTFNIPDLRGRTIAGQDDMGSVSADRLTGAGGIGGIDGDVLGSSGGAETVTLTESQIPAHEHSYNYSPDTGDTNNTTGIDVSGGSSAATTGTTGGGAAHVNIQPTLILNYIIKT